MKRADLVIENSVFEIACSQVIDKKRFAEIGNRATGTLVSWDQQAYLLTNWHVVTGRNPAHPDVAPDGNRVEYLILNDVLNQREYVLPLFSEDNKPLWLENPEIVNFEGTPYRNDLVAVPLAERQLFEPVDLAWHLGTSDEELFPNQEVMVVGYPFHRLSAIWKTCHIAECVSPQASYFLINGRTKPGMSGSPVYGVNILTAHKRRALVGIYSGRYNDNENGQSLNVLDIGIVWKLSNLKKLLPPIPPEKDGALQFAQLISGRKRSGLPKIPGDV